MMKAESSAFGRDGMIPHLGQTVLPRLHAMTLVYSGVGNSQWEAGEKEVRS